MSSVYYTTIGLIQLDSIQVPQFEEVPSKSKLFDSVHIYTTSETKPVRIDSNLHATQPAMHANTGLTVHRCTKLALPVKVRCVTVV